jgi:hypothetical protein
VKLGVERLRTIRKRKIVKMMKHNSIPLMNKYFNNEHALAVAGVSVISDERAWCICDTLSHYAHILYRNFSDGSRVYDNEWANSLLDFY